MITRMENGGGLIEDEPKQATLKCVWYPGWCSACPNKKCPSRLKSKLEERNGN